MHVVYAGGAARIALRGRRLQAVSTHPMFGPTQLVPSTLP
jgi:hypothetical protein